MLGGSIAARLRTTACHPARSGLVGPILQLTCAVLVAALLLVPSLSMAPPVPAQDLSDCVITNPACAGWPDPRVHLDRDGDGLHDDDEPSYLTDPDDWDTDDDGFSDGDEVNAQTLPWDAGSTPWVPPATIPGTSEGGSEIPSGSGGGGGPDIPDLICEHGVLVATGGPTGLCAPRVLEE
jgi:hypothetical protein